MDGRPDAATIELLVGAAAVVRRDNKASDAYIGRRFGLKPSVAAIVGETLVELGIVSEADDSGERIVFQLQSGAASTNNQAIDDSDDDGIDMDDIIDRLLPDED